MYVYQYKEILFSDYLCISMVTLRLWTTSVSKTIRAAVLLLGPLDTTHPTM